MLNTDWRISLTAFCAAMVGVLHCWGVASGQDAQKWREHSLDESNLRIAFPGKAEPSAKGLTLRVLTESYGISVDKEPREGSRKEIFERFKSNMTNDFSGTIIEYSPIRWHGHYGQEWSFIYQSGSGKLYVSRQREILIDKTLHMLHHQSMLFGTKLELDFIRHYDRNNAYKFFDSMKLIKPVEVTAKPEPEELDGRWIVEFEGGEPAKDPIELAFMGGAYFQGRKGQWGNPIGGIRKVGKYEVINGSPSELHIRWDSIPYNSDHAIFKIEGDTLTLQFGKLLPTRFTHQETLVLRRPGDESSVKKPTIP